MCIRDRPKTQYPKPGKEHQHALGRAVDITVAGVPPSVVHAKILQLIEDKEILQGGVGYYAKEGFVHYDIRGRRARWRG